MSTKYSNEYAYNKEYLDGYCITKKTLSLLGIYPQNSQIIMFILKEHSDAYVYLFTCCRPSSNYTQGAIRQLRIHLPMAFCGSDILTD